MDKIAARVAQKEEEGKKKVELLQVRHVPPAEMCAIHEVKFILFGWLGNTRRISLISVFGNNFVRCSRFFSHRQTEMKFT